jgi:ATP-dependent DNA helicase 2 subunit 2
MKSGVIGNLDYALGEISRPDIKEVRSALMGTVLRVGDVDTCSDEAFELSIKASKCTALARPKGWKKFALREARDSMDMEVDEENQLEEEDGKATFTQLRLRTEYFIDRNAGDEEDEEGDVKMKEEDVEENSLEDDSEKLKDNNFEKVEKEELVRGYKYGSTYAPCPDGQFSKLPSRKGIQICGFFPEKTVSTYILFFHLADGPILNSFAVNCPWMKFNIFGQIHLHHNNKWRYHQLLRL